MGAISSLDGVKRKHTPCFNICRLADLNNIKKGYAGTTAGDNGAVNIWIDDEGMYRCESMRFMVTLETKTFKYKTAVRRWFIEWREKIR